MDSIIPAAIAALASIAVVCYTQYKSKQLTFFETYFNKKLDAYSLYWEALCLYEQAPSTDAAIDLKSRLHVVALFAPANIYSKALTLTSQIASTGSVNTATMTDLIEDMRADLDNCKKMQF